MMKRKLKTSDQISRVRGALKSKLKLTSTDLREAARSDEAHAEARRSPPDPRGRQP